MNRPQNRPAPSVAHRFVFELLKLDAPAHDTHQESLDRVRSLRCFLDDFRAPVPSLPTPRGTSVTLPADVPFAVGQYLTQRVPAAGELPAYIFPLAGQPVLVIGTPTDHVVPDGARWDEDAQRWISEDVRVVVNTPAGPLVTSVDSGEFEAWTESSPAQDDVLAQARGLLEQLERDLLETIAQADAPKVPTGDTAP
jgi:hypothetical protein